MWPFSGWTNIPSSCIYTWENNDDDIVKELWEGGEALREGRTQVVEEQVEQGHYIGQSAFASYFGGGGGLQPTEAYGFITLFVQCYNAPSDWTACGEAPAGRDSNLGRAI